MALATKPRIAACDLEYGFSVSASPDDYPRIAIAPLTPAPEWRVLIGSGDHLELLRIQ